MRRRHVGGVRGRRGRLRRAGQRALVPHLARQRQRSHPHRGHRAGATRRRGAGLCWAARGRAFPGHVRQPPRQRDRASSAQLGPPHHRGQRDVAVRAAAPRLPRRAPRRRRRHAPRRRDAQRPRRRRHARRPADVPRPRRAPRRARHLSAPLRQGRRHALPQDGPHYHRRRDARRRRRQGRAHPAHALRLRRQSLTRRSARRPTALTTQESQFNLIQV
mmetsp:Transcript_1540/g.5539  ORF Transcript_1540/g.5539 Transcript_1540/m.5539 type:complete len:218 (+) Transcript_1540:625-1278(+)